MSEEHVHGWEPSPDEWGGYYCNIRNIEGKYCTELLSAKEVGCRLNATDALSAEDAREAAGKLGYVYKESRDILRAYADRRDER